jgi:hypothetical protein
MGMVLVVMVAEGDRERRDEWNKMEASFVEELDYLIQHI